MEEKNYKIALIIVGLIAIVIISSLGMSVANLNSRIASYQDNYEWKCEDGTYQQCVSDGHYCKEYNNDHSEYAIIVKEDETYAICDTDRKEFATCLEEGRQWIQCGEGEYPYCLSNERSWTQCSMGEVAKCLKENIYSVFTGTYVNECNIGEVAYCDYWD